MDLWLSLVSLVSVLWQELHGPAAPDLLLWGGRTEHLQIHPVQDRQLHGEPRQVLHTGGDIAAQDRSDRELPHHYHGENGLYGPICSNCHGVKSDSLLPWSANSRVTFATINIEFKWNVCQKLRNVTKWSVFQEIRDCPTYKENIKTNIQTNVPLNTLVGVWPCPRWSSILWSTLTFISRAEDNTGEQAADYNFCKFLLKENFHRKMTKAADRNVGYFG